MNKPAFLSLLAAAPFFTPLAAHAQFGGPNAKIATAAAAAPAAVVRGGKGTLAVTLSVKPAYHVNANHPNDPAYIPTVFTMQPVPGVVFGAARYPAPKLIKVSYSPKPLLVYQGQVKVTIPFTVSQTAAPGTKHLVGSVAFQGCDAKSCYPPASAHVQAALVIK